MSGGEAVREMKDGEKSEHTPDADAGSDEESSNEESPDDGRVEQLYAGRQRRKTQGNRYATLIGQEQKNEDDDELAALFKEDEGADEDFESSEAEDAEAEAEGEEDDSDTDNEDQGPAAAGDDLEGEKELRKQERAAQKAQKRKAVNITKQAAPLRKKVKIDESRSGTEALEQKRKKSERVSWFQTDTPVRKSSRALAVENKARTEAKLKADEARQLQMNPKIQAAQKRRQEQMTKPKTQAERLAEAAKVEELNSKSLNRWEEMENERKRKQKARLDAMQNRQIEGPVIRWRSTKAEWADGKLSKVGKTNVQVVQEPPARQPKPVLAALTAPPIIAQGDHVATPAIGTPTAASAPESGQKVSSAGSSCIVLAPPDPPCSQLINQDKYAPTQTDPPPKDGFATLIEEMQQYASKDKQDKDHTIQQPADHPPADAQGHSANFNNQATTSATGTVNAASTGTATPPTESVSAGSLPAQSLQQPSMPPARPPPPKEIAHSTHNSITLLNFSPHAIAQPAIQRHVLFDHPLPSFIPTMTGSRGRGGRKTLDPSGRSKAAIKSQVEQQAPPKPDRPLCAVTGQLARFRDPMTGLPYASQEAFRTVRRLVDGRAQWSGLLGAWVGTKGDAAKAVPEGFRRKIERKENEGAGAVKAEVAA